MSSYQNTQTEFVSVKDRQKIFYQKWIPNGTVKRILVIQHGIGEHSNRYMNAINILENSQTAIYALDARGHGRTPGRRGHVDQFQYFIDDLSQLVDIAQKENPGIGIHLMGHSMGGLIADKFAVEPTLQKKIKTLISSAAALTIPTTLEMEVKKTAGEFLSILLPALTLPSGLDATKISHDKQVVDDYLKDPMVHPMVSLQLATQMFKVGPAVLRLASIVEIPTYVFHGAEDALTDPQGSRDFYVKISSKDKKLNIYDGMYHETMNELPELKEIVLRDLKDWLLTH